MTIESTPPPPAWRGLGQLAPRPEDAGLTETTLEAAQVWQGRLLDVRRDRVRLPDGGEAVREYIVHPGAVMVLPLLDDDHAVMVRQHRHAIGGVLLEFPAGKLERGEDPAECARRELAEETGYHAGSLARLGLAHLAVAYSTEGIDLWLARGLQPGPAAPDPGEFVEPRVCSLGQLDDLAQRGELTDAKTLIGLWWWRRWREGRLGALRWC